MPRRRRMLFGEAVKPLKFDEYAKDARDCDLLLWEPTSYYGRLISFGTGGPMSHISTVLSCNGIVWSAGLEEKSGRGVKAPLKGEVSRWPGKISVFRVCWLTDEYRDRIRPELLRNLEASYGWGAIGISALWQIGLFRLSMVFPHWRALCETQLKSNESRKSHAVCSQYVHRSFSNGIGRPMFVKKSDSLVTPNDIGQSADALYLGTLTP